MKKVNIGIVGLGTIGMGVAEELQSRTNYLEARSGIGFNLAKVFDLNKKAIAKLKNSNSLAAKNYDEIINDPSIDIVVELIGGINPAKDILEKAIRNKKHVVTANKALISAHGEELFKLARANNVYFGFEASVCGAIPVIKMLKESFTANKITTMYGIVNGTCNFIITCMQDHNMSFAEALKSAQAKGLAEANPSLDIDGFDSAHKLSILAMLAFGIFVEPKEIFVEGIRDLELQDILYAREWGYGIKLLAIAKRSEKSVELRVNPALIPDTHMLSSVKQEYNAVFIKGDLIQDSMVYGKGAGRYPTSSAVLSDIIDAAKCVGTQKYSKMSDLKRGALVNKISNIGELSTRYYLRFSAIDKPGVLANISSILAKYNISIATVSQKERKQGQFVPIVMLTHDAVEASMKKALSEIGRLKFIKNKTMCIRIER